MRIRVLAILCAAAMAPALPAAATAPVTVTPHNPVDPTVIAQDKATIAADKLILKGDPKGSAARQDARIALATAKLQFALDTQSLGVPGPLEGVGLPIVLIGAAGAAVVWSRRRRGPAGAANDSASES